ncbi:MAG TPA: hypothetical protein VGB45_06805 [Abditibacterium sp.]
MISPTAALLWLDSHRIGLQCGWFALCGFALWLSVAALHFSDHDGLFRITRGVWFAAMLAIVVAWLAGAALELMRRAAGISGRDLVVALGSFSVLIAAVLSLVREWFGARWNDEISGDRLALSLVVLTLAGWWFGGTALEANPLWKLQSHGGNRAPDAWALLLGGATLLGLSHLARSRDESVLRARNPRVVALWIAATALLLGLPVLGSNPLAASVFLVGAGPFLVKIWRARRDKPLFLRVNCGTRAVLVICFASMPLWGRNWNWDEHTLQNWQTPIYWVAFVILGTACWALGTFTRELLRLAVFDYFCRRALLNSTLIGALAAIAAFGPAGAIFWAFWPLAGLFFDLLAPDESQFTAANFGASPITDPVSAGS